MTDLVQWNNCAGCMRKRSLLSEQPSYTCSQVYVRAYDWFRACSHMKVFAQNTLTGAVSSFFVFPNLVQGMNPQPTTLSRSQWLSKRFARNNGIRTVGVTILYSNTRILIITFNYKRDVS